MQEVRKSAVYASSDDLYERYKGNAAIEQLASHIMDGVFEIASTVNAPYWEQPAKLDIELISLWFQMSNDHAFHETHIHGNCAWSGVYYVETGDCSTCPADHGPDMANGVTRFYGPHMEVTAGGHGEFGNLYLQDAHFDSYPENGKLVVFPPHIKHMPFPYNGAKDRVIVSFNAQLHNLDGFGYGYSFS